MAEQTNMRRIRAVWRHGKKYIPLFVIAEICILISYGVSLILPLNLTRLTDKVLYGGQHELLREVILSYVLLFAAAAIFNVIYAYTWQTLSNRFVVDIKNTIFTKAIYAKAEYLAKMNSGDVMSRIDYDSEQFLHVVQRNLFHFVNSLLLCAGVIYMAAKINITIAVMLVIAAVLPVVLTRFCGRFTGRYAQQSREAAGAMTGRLFEILKGFREIRLMCAAVWAKSQVMEPLKRLAALGNRIRRVDFCVGKGIYFVNLTASLIIYSYSAHLIMGGRLTIGLFLAIVEYTALMHRKFNWALRIYLDWYGRKLSIDRVNEILETENESDEGDEIDQIESIEFRNVSFGYGKDKLILKNVSFRINKGERVAIVGASGVGKTTLTGLITRLYTPTSGGIYINGKPIGELKLSGLRSAIGMVSQDIMLFDETVRFNLQLGTEYTDDELWSALDRAYLRQAIEGLPEGLDTRLNASADLSGGQKQRLMLARLFLKRARFIILDEATSALDTETESNIIDNIEASEDVTVLAISHRPAAIRHCNRVVPLHIREVQTV